MNSFLFSILLAAINVQAPNLVAVDEQFNVTFVIDGEHSVSGFNWSPGEDFKLVWGPQKGSSTSISIVNGKRSTSVQTSYTYILMPLRAGTFRLPAASATVNGEEISSGSVAVEVASDGASSVPSDRGRQNQESSAGSTGTVSTEDIFLRLVVGKTSAVLGEPVSASLKLYQRVSVSGFEDARFPAFDGFWSQETYSPTNIEFKRENIGDRIYNTAVLRSWTLIPQRTGTLEIEPAEFVCLVNVRSPRSSGGSIFDSFFQDDFQTIRKRVVSPSVKVRVSSLPAGAPASFSGGVGSFKMSASLTKDSLKTHDAASLIVKVTGTGNVALLEAPKINFPPDFECYDVKVTDIPSGKSFEFPFIPRSSGEFSIGPVDYSYYDVADHRYVTLQSDALNISVGKSGVSETSSQPGQVAAPVAGKDVRNIGNDIRFIKTVKPEWSGSYSFFAGSALFWILLIFLLAAAAAVYFLFRVLAGRRADVAGTKNRTATKMARKRLASAGRYMDEGLMTAFYESLHKALLGFVSDKFNMDMSDMTRDNVVSRFTESGISEELVSEFTGLLDACDEARYSPSSDPEAMKRLYETAVSVISSVDGNMKRKHKTGAFLLTVVLLSAASPFAGAFQPESADSLWTAGVGAYSEGRWQDAERAWSEIVSSGQVSPVLYYNLGNACCKLSDYAGAVLNYERALKLDPSFSDAVFNLEYVNGLLVDRIESVPEFFLKTWFRKLSGVFRSDVWAVIALVLLAMILALFLVFLLSRVTGRRKAGFFGSVSLVPLFIVAIVFAFSQKAASESAGRAVIIPAVTSVKSAPGDSSVDLFVLHEGTVIRLLDAVGGWSNIELPDGRQGWMKSSDCLAI